MAPTLRVPWEKCLTLGCAKLPVKNRKASSAILQQRLVCANSKMYSLWYPIILKELPVQNPETGVLVNY